MNRDLFISLHMVNGYAILLYAVAAFYLDYRIKAADANTPESLGAHKRYFLINKIMSYVVLISFLTGGYLGTPFFKAGAVWIYVKVGLFLLLSGIQGAFGSLSLKKRIVALEENRMDTELFLATRKKLNYFLYGQLAIVLIILYLAIFRPF